MQRKTALALALSATTLLSGNAWATGFSTARFGGELGTPMAYNPTAIYYNPASFGASKGINVMIDGNIAFRQASYERFVAADGKTEIAEPADAQGANNGRATLFNIAAAPMLGATASFDLAKDWSLAAGAALFVPLGGSSTWDTNEKFRDSKYAGPVDGVQRHYTINGTQRTMYISAAVSAGWRDMVYLGVSGGAAMSTTDSLRAREFSGSTDLGTEGRAWFKGSSIDPQLGVGLLVRPFRNNRLNIGVSYQASPGFGRMKLKGLLQKYTAPGVLSGQNEGSDDVELHQTLPDVIRFGASWRPIKRLELRAFGDFTRWSLFDDQCIAGAGKECEINEDGSASPDVLVNLPRRWQDAVGVRLGASYWLRRNIEAQVGIGYDGNAIPDATLDPAITDFHDINVTLGARLRMTKTVALQLAYTNIFYVPRNTSGKSQLPELKAPSIGPDSSGNYRQYIGVLNVNLALHFDPFTKTAKAKAPATNTGGVLGNSW